MTPRPWLVADLGVAGELVRRDSIAKPRGVVAWGPMLAYATLITIPVLALFLSFQRAFSGSIASSGVKG